MHNCQIVVDLTFGDGGKGITVANLCNNGKKNLVVRFSGGPNAGHAVIHKGIKHTFSSFGSGTLQGQHSYFSEHTTMYLPNLCREYEELVNKGVNPILYLNPMVNIITPYDIAYHGLMEHINNHSSTGIGHGQTMIRNETTGYKLYAVDFTDYTILQLKLKGISDYYFNKVNSNFGGLYEDKYIKFYLELLSKVKFDFNIYLEKYKCNYPFRIATFNYISYNYENFIFEGSQGILLDMNHGTFPHVTYTNTTSKNAVEIIKNSNSNTIYNPEIYYVTRCYQTRHGNGWMSNNDKIELINNEEEINVYNKFQGEFKIGEFDYDMIRYSVNIDSIYNPYKKNIVISCIDQRPDFKINTDLFHINIQKCYTNSSPYTGYLKFFSNCS